MRTWMINGVGSGLVAVTLLAGCQQGPKVQRAASAEEQRVLLDRVKTLEGKWANAEKPGEVAIVYQVTSAGTAVRETMMPGSPHEMINMYTMDGPDLVMTHYCAQGNQPRMRAEAGAPTEIKFQPDSVTNLTKSDGMYMGKMTLVMPDADHVEQHWTSLRNGKPTGEHDVVFKLVRIK